MNTIPGRHCVFLGGSQNYLLWFEEYKFNLTINRHNNLAVDFEGSNIFDVKLDMLFKHDFSQSNIEIGNEID